MSFDKFRITTVFYQTLKAYNAGCTLIINQGGVRSGKTTAILQVIFLVAYYSKTPKIISVVSRALPHLKLGAMRDFDNIIQSYGLSLKCKNITNNTYQVGKCIVEFFGADQLDKVHGPGRDILFLNEANFIKFDVFDQLFIRTKGVTFVDFNPTRKFWIHDFVNKPNVAYMKSTYLDNELIPQSLVEKIEAKRENKAWWRVYGEGEIGIAEGAILQNWSYGKFPENDPYLFGLDYGFSPDPDALVKVCVDERGKKIYAHECIYENYNGTDELIAKMKDFCKPTDLIVAESASPRTNYDLKKYFKGLEAVSKTKTVGEWLRKMQDYEIVITEESYNLEVELSNYVWDDQRAGIPLGGFDHCFTGETKIITREGIKNIKDIRKGDYVLTSNGFRYVFTTFNNGLKEVFVYKLYFSDICIELRCTSNHLIKTNKGWKQISQLEPGMRIYLLRSLTVKNIVNIVVNGITQEGQIDYTKLFGNITMVKFLKVLMFTIKMKIQRITKSAIWNLLIILNIAGFTLKEGLKKTLNFLEGLLRGVSVKQRNGMEVRQVKNGIKNTMNYTDNPCMSKKNTNVSSVVKSLCLPLRILNSVPMLTNHNSGVILELTILKKNVYFVRTNSKRINTPNKNIVRTLALLKIESIKDTTECTYDLTVDQNHEYFANGILVHNCIDSLRYAYMRTQRKIRRNL